MSKVFYVVFYAVSVDAGDDGTFLDFPYFGGETASQEEAEKLARSITEDRNIPGTTITKVIQITNGLMEAQQILYRQFNQMANNMYDIEDIQKRKRKKK